MKQTSSGRKLVRLVLLFTALALPLAALELSPTRGSPYDLAVSGDLVGVPPGEVRYLRWAELRALPTTQVRLSGEFVPGEQAVTALFLSDLLRALPVAPGVDVVLATCSDGYASIYRDSFIAQYRPFLVLEINGEGPERWPPPGLNFNPGPYVITVSDSLTPGVGQLLDIGHKRPWGVAALELANFAQREADAFTGRWATLSPAAEAGREIWINSCASCHPGPGKIFGGTKSGRPFPVLEAHAGYNRDYFKRYVRNPQGMVAGAKMEAHPHYSDAQLEELIAFITATPP